MKIFIITIDEVNDYVNESYKPEVHLTKAEAQKSFKAAVKQAKKDYKDSLDEEYVQESWSDHFECYRDGYFAQDHYSITIHTVEVDGIKKVA